MMFAIITLILSLYSTNNVAFLLEGDNCALRQNNATGKCVNVDQCQYAKDLLQRRLHPQLCGFDGNIPLVCCSTHESITAKRFGFISQKKCFDDYYNGSRYTGFYAGGIKARSKEFPHMAAVGFGDSKSAIVWLCGATLISHQFVLSAAHCSNSSEFGAAKWIRLGDLDLKNTTEDADPLDLAIIQIIIHPEYKISSHYHDVALFKLEEKVFFGLYYNPACLQIETNIPVDTLGATGWGKQGFFGESSSHLLKGNLKIVPYETCAKRYADVSALKLKNGILDQYQLCAGDSMGGDTCPGDSGGPLHYFIERTPTVKRHFVVAGITSFGKGCGGENSVGVYTRVSAYVGWIESIVWAEEE